MSDPSSVETTRSLGRLRKWGVRAIKAVGFLLTLYALIVLIGLLPANNDFQPDSDGVQIHVTSNAVHADVIVPVSNSVIDWRQEFSSDLFSGSTLAATHVAFGWGDKGFFIETPTWGDLKVSTAANALLIPSDSCMHVVFTNVDSYGQDKRSVFISQDQYRKLIEFIKASFETNKSQERILISDAAYGSRDAFFESHGHYHALNTCNSWAGRALRTAGVRTPWLTPMPKSPMLYLPADSETEVD